MLFTLETAKTSVAFDFSEICVSGCWFFFSVWSTLVVQKIVVASLKKKKNQVKPGLSGSQMHFMCYAWPSEHKRPLEERRATVWVFRLSPPSSHWCSTFRANHEHICARPLKCAWVSACVRWCMAVPQASRWVARLFFAVKRRTEKGEDVNVATNRW